MQPARVLTSVRLVSIVVVMAAITAQAVELATHGRFDATRFFAFFTIQSNLIGVVAYVWLVAWRDRPRTRGLELLRGAATVYLIVTFFVVIVLLSDVDVQLQLGWVDVVLHKLFPVILVLDWIVDPPALRLAYRDALIWLIYPLVWVSLTLLRGAAAGWYPYPFLNPVNGGYGTVAATVVSIIVGFFVLAIATIALGNARRATGGRGGRGVSPAR